MTAICRPLKQECESIAAPMLKDPAQSLQPLFRKQCAEAEEIQFRGAVIAIDR